MDTSVMPPEPPPEAYEEPTAPSKPNKAQPTSTPFQGFGKPSTYPPRFSEQREKLFAALAKAQAKIGNAAKDSTNPHFKSKYADLASVRDASMEALAAEGLCITQFPYNADSGIVGVLTVVGHESGQWMEGSIEARPMKSDAQGIGAVTTYLRRYAWASLTGVAAEDDDGNAASGVGGGNDNRRQNGQDANHGKKASPNAMPNGKDSPGVAATISAEVIHEIRDKLLAATDQAGRDAVWDGYKHETAYFEANNPGVFGRLNKYKSGELTAAA